MQFHVHKWCIMNNFCCGVVVLFVHISADINVMCVVDVVSVYR